MSDPAELEQALLVDASSLRARIRAMDSAAQAHLFAGWANLPDLADEAGNSVAIHPELHAAIEQWVTDHEPPAPGLLDGLRRRYDAMPPGCRVEVDRRIGYLSLDGLDFTDPATFTVGRAMTVEQILNDVDAGADAQVAAVLGPLPAPGEIIPTPVADVDALADAVDWSSHSAVEVIALVTASPWMAAEALAAERRRAKPRKGVVDKLAPLVGGVAALPPAQAPAAPAAEPSGEVEMPALVPGESVGEDGAPGQTREPTSLPSPVFSDEGEANARPLTPPSSDAPPTTAPAGEVAEPPVAASPADDRWPPLKFAAILGRLGAEMIAVSNQIQAHWSPAPPGTTTSTVDL